MTQRLQLYLEDDFIEILKQLKPKSLSLSAFCGLCIEQHLASFDNGSRVPAYCVGAETQQGNLRPLTGAKLPPKQPQGEVTTTCNQPTQVETHVSVLSNDQELEPKKKQENKVANSRKSKAKRTVGSPEFESFWSQYQSCSHKANGQSKPNAWDVWQQVVDFESPERLQEALRQAIDDIDRRQAAGDFASPLPDCFRWLRDARYAVYLEDHKVKVKPSWML